MPIATEAQLCSYVADWFAALDRHVLPFWPTTGDFHRKWFGFERARVVK
jgi:hypothetical protein